jgi:hypothetical protein
VDYAISLSNSVHEARFKKKFLERPLVLALFDNTPAPAAAGEE